MEEIKVEKIYYKIKFGIMRYCGMGFHKEELIYDDFELAEIMYKKLKKWKNQLDGYDKSESDGEYTEWVDNYDGYLYHLYGLYRVIEVKLS